MHYLYGQGVVQIWSKFDQNQTNATKLRNVGGVTEGWTGWKTVYPPPLNYVCASITTLKTELDLVGNFIRLKWVNSTPFDNFWHQKALPSDDFGIKITLLSDDFWINNETLLTRSMKKIMASPLTKSEKTALSFGICWKKWHVVDKYMHDNNKWALTRENLSSRVCEQHRRRPACASAQSDQRLCYSLFGKYHM